MYTYICIYIYIYIYIYIHICIYTYNGALPSLRIVRGRASARASRDRRSSSRRDGGRQMCLQGGKHKNFRRVFALAESRQTKYGWHRCKPYHVATVSHS